MPYVRIQEVQRPPMHYVHGRCGVCREETGVKYCPLCGAVICTQCRGKYFKRGTAFVKSLFGDYKGELLSEH